MSTNRTEPGHVQAHSALFHAGAMTRPPRVALLSRGLRAAAAALALLPAMAALAQQYGGIGELEIRNVPYNGQFTFARLTFETAPGGYYYGGLPAWAHGYPNAELNLMHIVDAVTLLRPRLDGSNAFAVDDPELFRHPVAFMTEAGFWMMTDEEAASLRAYLAKGGFVIFDDFRNDLRNAGWANFEKQIGRVLPDVELFDLTPEHPIFHSFFHISSFDIIPQYYDRGDIVFRGIYEDNDPNRRLLAVVNFNTDTSNFWEFRPRTSLAVDPTNEAYRLGVNYVVYALTH